VIDYSSVPEDDKTLEQNRRLEYGDSYDHFFRRCNNCHKIFHIRNLYYIDKNETVMVCELCYKSITYEQETRELRRMYKS
jgi:hypothetical protein